MSLLGFSGALCSWLASYLSDSTIQFRIDSVLCSPISIASVGIPQGSPLSPVLSSIYSLPVLLAFTSWSDITIKGYIDDFTILSASQSFSSNLDIIEAAVETVTQRLNTLGLSFEMDKCELIHFAARKADLASNPDIELEEPGGPPQKDSGPTDYSLARILSRQAVRSP
jgi:hypothetical protein